MTHPELLHGNLIPVIIKVVLEQVIFSLYPHFRFNNLKTIETNHVLKITLDCMIQAENIIHSVELCWLIGN